MSPAARAGRPDHSTTTVSAVRGWLHPRAGESVDTHRTLTVLRERGVLAGIQEAEAGVDDLCDLTLLVDDEGRLLVQTTAGVVGGPLLHDYAPELAEALGAAIEIDGEFHDVDPLSTDVGAPGGGEGRDSGDMLPVDDESDFAEDFTRDFPDELFVIGESGDGVPDVLLTHLVPSALPQLARAVGSGLVAGHVDGWTLVQFDEDGLPVAEHGWLPGDLPVVHLTRVGDDRYVQVITAFGLRAPHVLLARHGDQVTTYGPDEVDPDLVDTLVDSHLAPASELHTLLESKHFAHVDARTLAEALQQPMDEQWVTGVLRALGLPTLAGDVLEGRAQVPSPTRVEHRSVLGSVGEMVLRYYDAPAEEVARRTPYGKAYAAVTATPRRVGATVAAESALAAWLLWRSRRLTGARRHALAAAAVGTLIDVACHAVLAPLKFRRR